MTLIQPMVRQVEAQMLDRHHEGFAILKRSPVTAVSHALKVFGNILREFHASEFNTLTSNAWVIEQTCWLRALEQVLRWILMNEASPRSFSEPTHWSILDREALEILGWANSYVRLCDDHIAASQGFYTAICDEKRREITFIPNEPTEPTVVTTQLASDYLRAQTRHDNHMSRALDGLFTAWIANFEIAAIHRPEDLPNVREAITSRSQDMDTVLTWIRTVILPELDDDNDLHGFTLGQLRRFWTYLFVESWLMTRLELKIDSVVGQNNDFGSTLYQGSREELARNFSDFCDIESSVIESIIECLTFEPTSKRSTATNSPFVVTECRTISLLCWHVVALDENTMISSALAKRSRSKLYESLITRIERRCVRRISQAFQKAGYTTVTDRELVTPEQNRIRPDILVYDARSSELLIVEYKHAIPPSGAGQVCNRLKDFDAWQCQLAEYLATFDTNRAVLGSLLSFRPIRHVYGMLLFRWPMAIPVRPSLSIVCADTVSLLNGLDGSYAAGFAEILKFYRNAFDADFSPRRWEVRQTTIRVGSWRYHRPLLVAHDAGEVRRGR